MPSLLYCLLSPHDIWMAVNWNSRKGWRWRWGKGKKQRRCFFHLRTQSTKGKTQKEKILLHPVLCHSWSPLQQLLRRTEANGYAAAVRTKLPDRQTGTSREAAVPKGSFLHEGGKCFHQRFLRSIMTKSEVTSKLFFPQSSSHGKENSGKF